MKKQPQTLRPYQQAGLDNILKAYSEGARCVLMILPTGGGKTTVFASLAAQIHAHGKRTLVLVHRRELAQQAAKRFEEFGIEFGFIMAGEESKPWAKVQIATVQTLTRRRVPKADLVIPDEAHLSTAKTWATILEKYPEARILGATATPWRLGGKPLIGTYDASVVVSTPSELREQGFLCPYQGFAYKAPDLSQIKVTAGDYNEKQSSEAMRQPQLVANVVEQWKKHASHLSTVVFATSVEHSKELTAEFNAAGAKAEHLDGTIGAEERKAILSRVASGETQVLSNVSVCVEGIDIPRLKCCILARPTMSLARAIQMMGRVRRPWKGQSARIHDHAFVIQRHGLPDAERDYTLNPNDAPDHDDVLPSISTCPDCFAMFQGTKCPACGVEKPVVKRGLETVADAERIEFEAGVSAVVPGNEVVKPPVRIDWSDAGRVIEGVFSETYQENTQWGPLNRHVVQGEKRKYVMHGTVRLDALMKTVRPGKQIRVSFTGTTTLGGGRTRKEFKLEVDDGEAARAKLMEEARRLYVDEKMSTLQIGEKFGVSASAIQKWLKKLGVTMRKGPDEKQMIEVKRLYTDEKMSVSKVEEKLGVNRSTIQKWLKKLNVTMRTLAEASSGCDEKQMIEAKRLYTDEKMSCALVGKTLGVNHITIYGWLKRLGVTMRTPTRRSDEKQMLEAKRLYVDEKMSTAQIGEKLGVSADAIQKWLKKLGVRIRTPSESAKNRSAA